MKKTILFILKFYKKVFSPILHSLIPGAGCRFYPSCSNYTYQAINKYGFLKGGLKSLKRILRCHPFNPGGYDPLK